jgi:hypothetical protein
MKSKRPSKLKHAVENSQDQLIIRLKAENVMLKNHNEQLNIILNAWYAAFKTNQLSHALARLEAAEKRMNRPTT